MASYKYTVLSTDAQGKNRRFYSFFATRGEAEAVVDTWKQRYAKMRFSVATIKVDA